MNISIFYEKKDKYKTIRDLTYHIGNVGADLKTTKENIQDIDIAKYSYDDAKYIRKEMQINNEDLYLLYIYIDVYAESPKELEAILNNVEGTLQSNGIQTRRANFRQEQVFFSCLPFFQNDYSIKNASRRNILTNGLVGTYPFISSSIFDEDGVLIRKQHIQQLTNIHRQIQQRKIQKRKHMCIWRKWSRKIIFYKTTNSTKLANRNRPICNRSRKRIPRNMQKPRRNNIQNRPILKHIYKHLWHSRRINRRRKRILSNANPKTFRIFRTNIRKFRRRRKSNNRRKNNRNI